eukprot:1848167-Lingulodinium_polyedra.AAC.1
MPARAATEPCRRRSRRRRRCRRPIPHRRRRRGRAFSIRVECRTGRFTFGSNVEPPVLHSGGV